MAVRKIASKIELQGEQQYKQAVGNINKALSVLDSEMAKVTAQFGKNSDSVEALQAKNDVLNRKLLTQRDKVEELREALQKSAEAYGESDKRTMDWQRQLNNAEAAEIKLTQEIAENAEAIKRQNSEFTRQQESLKQAATQLGVLESELNKVRAQYGATADSADGLRAQNEVLTRIQKEQSEQVERLRKSLNLAAKEFGANSEEVSNLKIELNNAEAALYKTTNTIDANNDAVAKSNESLEDTSNKFNALLPEAKGLGDEIQVLAGKFNIRLPQGLTKSLNSVKTFSAGAVAGFAAVTASVVALEQAEKKLMDITHEAASLADTLLTDSSIKSLSTDTLQEMAYASELIDVSADTITSSMTRLTRNMGKARDGSSELQEAFASLGVSFEDGAGHLRDRSDVFYDLVDALGNVTNETERDELAMKLLGKSAEELNPLIEQGSGRMRELAEEAHNTGYVMSTEQLQALGAVDDAYQRLQLTQEKMRNHMATKFAPTAEEMYTKWGEFIDTVGEKLVNSGIIENLGSILDSTVGLLTPLMQLATEVLPVLGAVLDPIAGTIAWIADTADAAIAFLTLDFNKWNTALGYNPNEASHLQRWMYGADYKTDSWGANSGWVKDPETGWYVGNYSGNATGNSNFPGGVTRVGEAGPETVILPSGAQILNAQESRNSGGDTFVFNISADNVREFNDLVDMAQSYRRRQRMKGARA